MGGLLAAYNAFLDTSDHERSMNALDEFKKLLLAMAMTMSHELAHVFTNFLSGLQGKRENTPQEVNYSPR